jgi:hypothetical protein
VTLSGLDRLNGVREDNHIVVHPAVPSLIAVSVRVRPAPSWWLSDASRYGLVLGLMAVIVLTAIVAERRISRRQFLARAARWRELDDMVDDASTWSGHIADSERI